MEEPLQEDALVVYSLDAEAVPLDTMWEALRGAGLPAEITVGIAGPASVEELTAPEWEAAFLRWRTPEIHEVAMVDRMIVGVDEEADLAITRGLAQALNYPESAGKLIVADHLRRVKTVYLWELLPALLAEEDHPAWEAIDIAIRSLAQESDGIVYAQSEGFYDADGEVLLGEGTEESELFEDVAEDDEDG